MKALRTQLQPQQVRFVSMVILDPVELPTGSSREPGFFLDGGWVCLAHSASPGHLTSPAKKAPRLGPPQQGKGLKTTQFKPLVLCLSSIANVFPMLFLGVWVP